MKYCKKELYITCNDNEKETIIPRFKKELKLFINGEEVEKDSDE